MPSFLYDIAHHLKAAALDKKASDFPRTIIFCKSHALTDSMWEYLSGVLACERPEVANPREYVQKYHAESSDELKKNLLATLKNPDSNLRIVVATSAFGMGVDIPNFRVCVHWGVPGSLQCYVQESGRICRDGKGGVAYLMYNLSDLNGISPEDQDTKPLRDFLLTKSCRRQVIMNCFHDGDWRSLHKTGQALSLKRCCDTCDPLPQTAEDPSDGESADSSEDSEGSEDDDEGDEDEGEDVHDDDEDMHDDGDDDKDDWDTLLGG